MKKQLIVLSAPSGAGKTTVAKHLLERFPFLLFSVSATTRTKRQGEVDAKDYFFLDADTFRKRIEQGDLIEYEEIFGNYYGTLKSVVSESLKRGDFLIFDVDVKGAVSLKKAFPDDAILLFIAPPSIATLAKRLRNRHTETEEQVNLRLARAEMEMGHQSHFDHVIVNDDLEETLKKAVEVVQNNTEGAPEQKRMF